MIDNCLAQDSRPMFLHTGTDESLQKDNENPIRPPRKRKTQNRRQFGISYSNKDSSTSALAVAVPTADTPPNQSLNKEVVKDRVDVVAQPLSMHANKDTPGGCSK